jgi:nicotinamide-nucleotide amidase
VKKVSCEIICVGTEILLGDIVNTNAQYISSGLAQSGIDVFYETVVGDNPERLERALAIAKGRADIIIMTGGLGPTYDDLTKETVARSFGKKLIMNEKCLEELVAFFAHINRPMTDNNKKQAVMPEDCIILENPQGTAPGCIIEGEDGKIAIMMPGPPREMVPMFDNLVKPYLRKFSEDILVSRVVRVIGIGESSMEGELIDMMESMTNPTIAPYAKSGECIVRVTAKAHDKAAAYTLIDPLVEEIRRRLGAYVYGVDIDSLEQHVVELLTGLGKTVAFAEICTGGLAAKRISDIVGASKVLKLGLTTFTIEEMLNILGVQPAASENGDNPLRGAITVIALGVHKLSDADIGVSIIVSNGTVCFAVTDGVKVEVSSFSYSTSRDREYTNTVAVNRAYDMIRLFATGITPK